MLAAPLLKLGRHGHAPGVVIVIPRLQHGAKLGTHTPSIIAGTFPVPLGMFLPLEVKVWVLSLVFQQSLDHSFDFGEKGFKQMTKFQNIR